MQNDNEENSHRIVKSIRSAFGNKEDFQDRPMLANATQDYDSEKILSSIREAFKKKRDALRSYE